MRLFKYDHVFSATNWVFGPKNHMKMFSGVFPAAYRTLDYQAAGGGITSTLVISKGFSVVKKPKFRYHIILLSYKLFIRSLYLSNTPLGDVPQVESPPLLCPSTARRPKLVGTFKPVHNSNCRNPWRVKGAAPGIVSHFKCFASLIVDVSRGRYAISRNCRSEAEDGMERIAEMTSVSFASIVTFPGIVETAY